MNNKKNNSGFFQTQLLDEQIIGTGMAIVVILLFAGLAMHDFMYMKIAIAVLVLNMIIPKVFYPLAIIWLALSNVLGSIMPKIILSLLFIFFVVPLGVIRNLLGYDAMKLGAWKKDASSVFKNRDQTFSSLDLEKPY